MLVLRQPNGIKVEINFWMPEILFFSRALSTCIRKYILLLTTLTSGPNLCMIAAENAAPANNRR